LKRSLENSDLLVRRKNQELQTMGGILAAANQKISDRDAEIERLESELARRSEAKSENPTPEKSKIEAADLLNQLKARRKKSGASLADVELILEIIEES